MKMRFLFLAIISLFVFSDSKALDANVTYATFKGVDSENYIEVYLQVIGRSVEFAKVNDKYEASVEVTLLFKKGDQIEAFDKYVLKNPPAENPKIGGMSLLDMKRMFLPNGEYNLEVVLKDLNSPGNNRTYSTKVKMKYDQEKACVSDIQLLEGFQKTAESNKYVKHGYFLKPYTYTMYPSFVDDLTFFAEIYNTDVDLGEDYLVRFYLQESGKNGEPILGHMGFRKQKPSRVNLLMIQMDIATVPTGNYDLVVEIRDNKNQPVFSRALAIKRNKPESFDFADYKIIQTENSFVSNMTEDELDLYLNSLAPIINVNALSLLEEVANSPDLEDDRQFILHFWSAYNEIDPGTPFENYRAKVNFANNQYSSAFDEGYETDRGYVYLKYGMPNDIIVSENEPAAPPYHIWKYYSLNDELGQKNVSFVFYNPSLAPENFVLLHSNARGEINDPQWQKKLYKNLQPGTPKEEWESSDIYRHFGGGDAGVKFDQY